MSESTCREWERFQDDVDDVIPLAVRTLRETEKTKETQNTLNRDSCNWVAALADNEIRDAQMQNLDTYPE